MNYFELEGPESTSEKSPLVCQVPHRDVRRPSSVKPCLILGGILGFVLLFGLGLWKYRIAGQFISYSLGATPDGNTTVTWDTDLQVEVDQGILQGKQLISRAGRNYLAFLGIPYAQPPIGNLRFRVLIHIFEIEFFFKIICKIDNVLFEMDCFSLQFPLSPGKEYEMQPTSATLASKRKELEMRN